VAPLQLKLVPRFCVSPLCEVCVSGERLDAFLTDPTLRWECVQQAAAAEGVDNAQCLEDPAGDAADNGEGRP